MSAYVFRCVNGMLYLINWVGPISTMSAWPNALRPTIYNVSEIFICIRLQLYLHLIVLVETNSEMVTHNYAT